MIQINSKSVLAITKGQSIVLDMYKGSSHYFGVYDNSKMIIEVPANTTITLAFTQSKSNGVLIDWGETTDDAKKSSSTKVTLSHTYVNAGQYVITFTRQSNATWSPGISTTQNGSTVYNNILNTRTVNNSSYLRMFISGLGFRLTNRDAFYNCQQLKIFIWPQDVTITTIPMYCFDNCASLQICQLPNSIQTIEQYAFYGCISLSLTELPTSLTTIGQYAFYGCTHLSIRRFDAPLEIINNYAFEGCTGLPPDIIINVTTLKPAAFGQCKSLERVLLQSGVNTLEVSNTVGLTVKKPGPFYQCDSSLILYAYCAENDKPNGWDEHFMAYNYNSSNDIWDNLEVVWNSEELPISTLVPEWNDVTRVLTFHETGEIPSGYSYNNENEILSLMT